MKKCFKDWSQFNCFIGVCVYEIIVETVDHCVYRVGERSFINFMVSDDKKCPLKDNFTFLCRVLYFFSP